ncbi:MAG: selenite/tellurite reduction operon c-type cytochrome lipoprotein ExtS [Desulfobacteraceae bacterium]|nr:selenite/tellurite reduction operon c-type cytochrome lipoprotein ExtS [Desulfobacteraceae bacterium]
MVARLLTTALLILLAGATASAALSRQLCLSCHPVHYAGQGSCTACHRGNPASERKNIAHQQLIAGRYARFTLANDPLTRVGVRLLEQYACRRCHVIGGKGNRLSVSLDQATVRRSPGELAASILRPVQNMPDFHMKETQVTAVVNALLSDAALQPPAPAARPQVVHFDQAGSAGRDLFSIKCGPCHQMLTERLGALGRGDAGPNLSGVLSPFYPKSFKDDEEWNAGRLRRWLDNPRAIRAAARMRPVKLSEAEFRDLLGILGVGNVK